MKKEAEKMKPITFHTACERRSFTAISLTAEALSAPKLGSKSEIVQHRRKEEQFLVIVQVPRLAREFCPRHRSGRCRLRRSPDQTSSSNARGQKPIRRRWRRVSPRRERGRLV